MWFYRYVVRGLGLVLIAGMVTLLGLALRYRLAVRSAHDAHDHESFRRVPLPARRPQ